MYSVITFICSFMTCLWDKNLLALQVCDRLLSGTIAWIPISWTFVLHTKVCFDCITICSHPFLPELVYFTDKRVILELFDVSYYRAGGNASEEALDRLPTSATCMNLLKLPPYKRFVIVLLVFSVWNVYIKICLSLPL